MPDNFGLTDEFDGEIIASGGIRILATNLLTPPDSRRVRWVEETNGAMVAQINGFSDPGLDVQGLYMAAVDEGGNLPNSPNAQFGAERLAGLLRTYAQTYDGISAPETRVLIDSNIDSNFAQRFSAGASLLADNRFNGGVVTPLYPGGSTVSNALAVNHGLGIAPTIVIGTPNVDPTTTLTDPYTVYTYGYGAAQFTMRTMAAGMPGAGTGIPVVWLAIAL